MYEIIITGLITGLAIFFANYLLERRKILLEKLYILQAIYYLYNCNQRCNKDKNLIQLYFKEDYESTLDITQKVIRPKYNETSLSEYEFKALKELIVYKKHFLTLRYLSENKGKKMDRIRITPNDCFFNCTDNVSGLVLKYDKFNRFLFCFDWILYIKLFLLFPFLKLNIFYFKKNN